MMRNVNLSRVSVSLAMSAIRKIDPEHWTMRRMCNWSFSHTHRTVRMWMKSNFRSIACTRFVEESHIMSEANSLGSDIIMMTDERISSLSFSVCFFFLLNCQSGFFTYCRKLYPFRFFLWSLVKKKKKLKCNSIEICRHFYFCFVRIVIFQFPARIIRLMQMYLYRVDCRRLTDYTGKKSVSNVEYGNWSTIILLARKLDHCELRVPVACSNQLDPIWNGRFVSWLLRSA